MRFTRRQSMLLLGASICSCAARNVKERWQQIAGEIDGTVGASALDLSSGRSVSMHGGERFPLASVCKLPIAIHILAMVDEGKFSLNVSFCEETTPLRARLRNGSVGER
jgi:beta-lactamase class A